MGRADGREAGLGQRHGLGEDATKDEGTFWAPEDRAWLWYNDTIETHAFALRTLMELDPDDARQRRPGAVAASSTRSSTSGSRRAPPPR